MCTFQCLRADLNSSNLIYRCTLLPLLFCAHPLHFLYAKFHADIAPIGGADPSSFTARV